MADPFNSTVECHSEFLLSQLNEFRKKNQFTDVILNCGGQTIAAHRNILAAISPYFGAMFGGNFPESTQTKIDLIELNAEGIESCIEFIYTGKLNVNEDNVQDLFMTASFLQLKNVEDLCASFMVQHLDPSNCLGFKSFAEKQNNALLLEASRSYTIMHFQEVARYEEFMDLCFSEFEAILSNDELYMHSDDSVLMNIARWAEHKPYERLPKIEALIKYLHPACVSAEVAKAIPILEKSQKWLDDVLQCDSNVEWRIFVLDKMGQRPQLQSFDTDFKIITPLKPLPQAAFGVSLTCYRNMLYAQGGSVGRSTARSFYYNVYRDQWHEMKPMKIERSHHRSVVLHAQLYAIGGNTHNGATASVECLNLATKQTLMCQYMLEKRSSMGAVASEQSIYVMGGETDNRSLYSMEQYDPRSGRWMELQSMYQVNSYCSSALLNDSIFCCEGLGSCMERFDIRANKWETIDFWEEREFYEIFVVNQNLYSVSGEEISHFDLTTNRWQTVHKYTTPHDWDTAVGLQMVSYFY